MLSSATDVKVGDSVDITITAAPNAPVYFLGVDQSVLLLKSGNDVDQKKVLNILQKTQENSWRPWPIWGGCGIWFPWSYGNSAVEKLNDAGFEVVSFKSFKDLGSAFIIEFNQHLLIRMSLIQWVTFIMILSDKFCINDAPYK